LEGCEFLPDEKDFRGPLSAIGRFTPQADFVFVASCDLPRFNARLVPFLRERIGEAGAAAPLVNGYRQPLCALYSASAFAGIPDVLRQDHACAMAWLDSVPHVLVPEEEIAAAGIDPQSAQGANTKQELAEMLQRRPEGAG
jgi:molybdenum cofactor guanylyltransferase